MPESTAPAAQGLRGEVIEALRAEQGYNELIEHRTSFLRKLAGHFWGPIPWMIEAAAVLSALARDWSDFTIILLMLAVNAGVAFWQEHKADNAIELLKQKLATRARVCRDGQWMDLPARELLAGDLIHLRAGDVVPADVLLLQGSQLSIDQAALTGESLPVDKSSGDTAYSGSIVRQGETHAQVTAIGMRTYFGKTAALVESAGSVSHFQQAVIRIGNTLIVATLVLVALVIAVGWMRGEPLLETLQFSLILTVAAIPVALPAVLSVTLAVGAAALSRGGAIVSRLAAIEELAGMDVLCSDKTGTLTQNRLSVAEPFCMETSDAEHLLRVAALACEQASNDPIDQAILAAQSRLPAQEPEAVTCFVPFDPVHKLTQATIEYQGISAEVAKGAPQAILDWASASQSVRDTLEAAVDRLAEGGYRSLAVARRTPDGHSEVLGLLPLYDPPREDSAETVSLIRKLKVKVMMITGDHVAIARQIAGRLGLGQRLVTAEGFFRDGREPSVGEVMAHDGYAQVFPEHKFAIVKSLQGGGHLVGMTGDGVNDAPALRQADVGIAVSGATDAARAAADLVLTEPGLGVIEGAIAEARRIFERMTAYAIFRITETLRVLLFMTLSILVFEFYPVTAVMIVLLALLNDFPIMMIAYDNARPAAQPVQWNMRRVLVLAAFLGCIGVIESFVLFWVARDVWQLPAAGIQTLIFLKLLVAGHLTLYLTRHDGHFWQRPFPSLKLFLGTECTQILGTLAAVYGWFVEPIGWSLALFVWGYALVWMLLDDLLKVWLIRLMGWRSGAAAR